MVRVLCDTDIETIAVEDPSSEVIGIISYFDILVRYQDADLDRGVAADVMLGPRWMWYHPESALTARPRLRVRSDRGTRN